MTKHLLLASALFLAGSAALAQQTPPAAAPHGGTQASHGAPGTASAAFKATVLHEAPLLGTDRRIYRLYTIDLGPSGATPRHMHPGDEIALVMEGAVTLETEGEAPRTFQTGQTFHPRPMTPHVARNALATVPARLIVSSITEAGRPSTIVLPPPGTN